MMTILRKRPLAAACALFITCLLLFSFAEKWVKLAASLAAAAVLLVLLLIPKTRLPAVALCLCAVVLACALSVYFFDVRLGAAQSLCGKDASITARIDSVSAQTGYASSYRVTIRSVDGEPKNVRAALYTDYASDARVGDTVSLAVSFVPFERDLYGFDAYRCSVANGLLLSCEGTDEASFQILTEGGQPPLSALLSRIRARIGAMIDTSARTEDAGFIKALLLGDMTDLDPAVNRDFRALGISHVLAISGTHLTVILGSMMSVLAFLRVRKRTRFFLLLLPLLFYVGLTGASPPILRAGLMLLLGEAAFFFGRKNDALTSLFTAVSLILTVSPYTVYDCGLWLSFAAMLALIAAARILERWKLVEKLRTASGVRAVAAAVLLFAINTTVTSIFASACVLPLAFLFFGHISVLAPAANLLIAPLINIVLLVSPLLVLLWRVPVLSGVVAAAVHTALDPALQISETVAAVPGALVPLNCPFSGAVIAVTLAAAIVLLLFVRRKRYAAAALLIGSLLLCTGTYAYLAVQREHTAVACVTEPTGDAMLFSVGTKTLLVDLSGGGYSVFQAAAACVNEVHATEIDALLLPHLTVRHVTSTVRFLQNTRVRTLILPVPSDAAEMHLFDEIARAASESAASVLTFSPDGACTLDFHGIHLTLFARQMLDRSTVPVLALSAEVDGKTVAYLGASFAETDADAIATDVTVLGSYGPEYRHRFDLSDAGRVVALSESARGAFAGDAELSNGLLWLVAPR